MNEYTILLTIMEQKCIVIGSDHRGYNLKEFIKDELSTIGFILHDVGPFSDYDPVDFPDYAIKACKDITNNNEKNTYKSSKGILICGSGQGMSMVANRIKGIRCALCNDSTMASSARTHNNANMLSLGADVVNENDVMDIIHVFLNTEFSGDEKYVRRNNKLDQICKKV